MSCRYISESQRSSSDISFVVQCFLTILLTFQVVKTGGTPKVPDCFQRTPKKLCIPEKAEILAVNVDSKGQSLHLMGVLKCMLNLCL